MGLKVCMLGSGSTGNCTYLASETTGVLIDAGLSYRETCKRLGALGSTAADIAAVCLTHEHSDHTTSLGVLHRRSGARLYANAGTVEAVERNARFRGLQWQVFATGAPFDVGDLRVEPFSVPHDSYDPVGFIVARGKLRVGIVTDMGMPNGMIRQRLRDCNAVIVESNHDAVLLKEAQRPWSLKQRIAGRQGHLSNDQAGALIAEIAGLNLRTVMLAHLSAECNRPELALETVMRALETGGRDGIDVVLSYPDRISRVIEIED